MLIDDVGSRLSDEGQFLNIFFFTLYLHVLLCKSTAQIFPVRIIMFLIECLLRADLGL